MAGYRVYLTDPMPSEHGGYKFAAVAPAGAFLMCFTEQDKPAAKWIPVHRILAVERDEDADGG
jgi:hypothetical protein